MATTVKRDEVCELVNDVMRDKMYATLLRVEATEAAHAALVERCTAAFNRAQERATLDRGALKAQGELIGALKAQVTRLTGQVSALSLKIERAADNARNEAWNDAVAELRAERGVSPGTLLPPEDVRARMRINAATVEAAAPMAVVADDMAF